MRSSKVQRKHITTAVAMAGHRNQTSMPATITRPFRHILLPRALQIPLTSRPNSN